MVSNGVRSSWTDMEARSAAFFLLARPRPRTRAKLVAMLEEPLVVCVRNFVRDDRSKRKHRAMRYGYGRVSGRKFRVLRMMLALAESFRAMDGRVSSARVPMPHKTLGERQCVRQSRTQSVLLLSLYRRPESAPRPCEIVGSASKTPTKRTARAGTRQAPHLKRHRTRGPGTVFSATRHGSPHAASPAHPSARAPATTAPTRPSSSIHREC